MGTPRIVPRKLGNFDFCVQGPPEASVQHLRVRALLQCLAPLVQVYSCSGAGRKTGQKRQRARKEQERARGRERETEGQRVRELFAGRV